MLIKLQTIFNWDKQKRNLIQQLSIYKSDCQQVTHFSIHTALSAVYSNKSAFSALCEHCFNFKARFSNVRTYNKVQIKVYIFTSLYTDSPDYVIGLPIETNAYSRRSLLMRISSRLALILLKYIYTNDEHRIFCVNATIAKVHRESAGKLLRSMSCFACFIYTVILLISYIFSSLWGWSYTYSVHYYYIRCSPCQINKKNPR